MAKLNRGCRGYRAIMRAHVLVPITAKTGRQNLSEYQRWDGRYGVPDYIFGKQPNHFLVFRSHQRIPKSA